MYQCTCNGSSEGKERREGPAKTLEAIIAENAECDGKHWYTLKKLSGAHGGECKEIHTETRYGQISERQEQRGRF